MPPQRIAVIGGTAAGPAAAAHAKRTDSDAEVVLFEQGAHISYGACEMPYYVSGQVADASDLIVLTPEEFERTRKAKVRTYSRVTAVDPRRHRLTVEHAETGQTTEERFDKFILAVGARPRLPKGLPIEAPNVFTMRRMEDAVAMRRYVAPGDVKHAVILGGGYIGVEMAEALRHLGIRVTVLEPGGALLHQCLDDEVLRSVVQAEAVRNGVIVRSELAVAFERDRTGRVHVVLTDRGERIGCQMVVVAIGIVPNTDLATAAGVHTGATGALAVDDQMRTNVPNVWACGDCVEVERVMDGARVYLPLSPVAFRSARVAAHNAARRGRGAPIRFPGVCMAAAVKVFGLEMACVGFTLPEALGAGFDAIGVTLEHWSRVRIYPGAKRLYVRYVVQRGSGRLLGAQLLGEEGAVLRADVLVPLVREGWSARDILDLDLIYSPPFAPSHDPLLVAASEALRKAGA